ncbi:MAG: SGNH/GDSL hydrolase family protein [Candidatus Sumerlaeota bacterium]
MAKWLFAAALMPCTPALFAADAPSPKPFPDGARVVFFGDSITQNGFYHPYIYEFYQTRFPSKKILMFNAGVSSGKTTDGLARAEWDVLAKKPTDVVIMLGMNDVGTSQYTEKTGADLQKANDKFLTRYKENMTAIVDRLQKEKDLRITLVISTPYDDTSKLTTRAPAVGKNDMIRKTGDILKAIGAEKNIPVVDFNTPLLEVNKAEQAKDPGFTIIGDDRTHPRKPGHLIAAYTFLKAQGLAGPVSRTTIDAKAAKATAANATASDLKVTTTEISWTLKENSLPYFVDEKPESSSRPNALDGLKYVPFNKDFNQETITVSGAPTGSWKLLIDKSEIGTYSAADLAKGIDLADAKVATPQKTQAGKVQLLNDKRWDAERDLRSITWMKVMVFDPKNVSTSDEAAMKTAIEEWKKSSDFSEGKQKFLDAWEKGHDEATMKAIQDKVDKLTADIYAANQPVPHAYQLVKAP